MTLNVSVESKAAMRFRGVDTAKAPLFCECPMYFRISWFVDQNDVWWSLRDQPSAREALGEILEILTVKGIPFLDQLQTDSGILRLYDSGLVLGMEIDRDETRVLLLAGAGSHEKAAQRLTEYETRWVSSRAGGRASAFLAKFKNRFGVVAEIDPA